MSAHLIAAGNSGGGLWAVGDDRRLVLYDATPRDRRLRTALARPLPGDARPLAAEPGNLTVLMSDALLRLSTRGQSWTRFDFKGMEGQVMDTEMIGAWPVPGSGGFVAVDRSRMLLVVTSTGAVTPFAPTPVPGTDPILACDPATGQVLLRGGTRLAFLGGRWVALGAPATTESGAAVSMKVRGLTDFCVEAGNDLAVGDVIDLPEKRALELIARGWCEPVAEPV